MEKTAKKIAPIVIAVALVILAYFLLTKPATEGKFVTKTPEGMVLEPNDVPSNYKQYSAYRIALASGSGTEEDPYVLPIGTSPLQTQFKNLPANVWLQAGFEDGYRSCFYYNGNSIYCITLRFSSIEGAKMAFSVMENSISDFVERFGESGRPVTIPKIGDQHCATEVGPYFGEYELGICFRKANILVFIRTEGPWVLDDAVGWARIVEKKIS